MKRTKEPIFGPPSLQLATAADFIEMPEQVGRIFVNPCGGRLVAACG